MGIFVYSDASECTSLACIYSIHSPLNIKGIEEAIDSMVQQGKLPLLKEMYNSWPFFTSTIDLIQMVLAKSEARIAGTLKLTIF